MHRPFVATSALAALALAMLTPIPSHGGEAAAHAAASPPSRVNVVPPVAASTTGDTSAVTPGVSPAHSLPAPDIATGARVDDAAPALTLAEAMRLALLHSPSLQADQFALQAGQGAVIQAQATPNPEIEALVEDTRRATRTTTVQVRQALELGGKRAARVAAATYAQAQRSIELQAAQARLRADVADAFHAAAMAQEQVRLTQASADLSARAAEAVFRRVQAGKVSPVEETRARVAQAEVGLQLAQAQAVLRSARHRLSALLGPAAATPPRALAWSTDLGSSPAVATPGVDSEVLAHTLLPMVEQAPAVRLARLEVDRRRALAEMERARRIPDFTVTLGAKREQETSRTQAVVGLAMVLPVSDTNRGNELEALHLQDKAESDLQATVIDVQTRAQELHERLLTAQAQVRGLQADVLPGAQVAWQAAVTGFEMGKFSFLETLDAQRTLLQARTRLLDALADYHRAEAEVERLLGVPTSVAFGGQP